MQYIEVQLTDGTTAYQQIDASGNVVQYMDGAGNVLFFMPPPNMGAVVTNTAPAHQTWMV